MKPITRSVLLITLLTWAVTSYSQSAFYLANRFGTFIDAPVFDAQGLPLAGADFVAELWGGSTADSLAPTLAAHTRQRIIVPFGTAGYFFDTLNGSSRGWSTVFSVLSTVPSALQVRAWDTRLGATYEAVAGLEMGGYGESPIFFARGTDPFTQLPSSPALLIGLQSFSLRPVPEPSTWALFGCGLAGLLWVLRRHKPNAPPL